MIKKSENMEYFLDLATKVEELKHDHEEIKDALAKAQEAGSFYQERYNQAYQIMDAVKRGYAKTPSFKPEFLSDEKYIDLIRNLCKQAVYSKWSTKKQASNLLEIYLFVKGEIGSMVSSGIWNKEWTVPGKRTIDRRTNEIADEKYWEEGITPVIAVKAGLYLVNPVCFDEETRKELEKLLIDWRGR